MPYIGRGEVAAGEILTMMFDLPMHRQYGASTPGIYWQVALTDIITADDRQDLAPHHVKSSVDFCIVTPEAKYAVYVNGRDHNGPNKSKKDEVRYRMLRNNGWTVVKLEWNNCPTLFKEKVNEYSYEEVSNAFFYEY